MYFLGFSFPIIECFVGSLFFLLTENFFQLWGIELQVSSN